MIAFIQAILPKGLTGSIGYSSNDVTNTKSKFTVDSDVYYTTMSIPMYTLTLEKQTAEPTFVDAVKARDSYLDLGRGHYVLYGVNVLARYPLRSFVDAVKACDSHALHINIA